MRVDNDKAVVAYWERRLPNQLGINQEGDAVDDDAVGQAHYDQLWVRTWRGDTEPARSEDAVFPILGDGDGPR